MVDYQIKAQFKKNEINDRSRARLKEAKNRQKSKEYAKNLSIQ